MTEELFPEINQTKIQKGSATEAEGIPDGWLGLDVGPKSSELFRATVLESKTILWNG